MGTRQISRRKATPPPDPGFVVRDASNTGVPAGTTLTSLTSAGAVYNSGDVTVQNLDWTINEGVGSGSAIEIREGAGTILIKNCKLKSNAAFYLIQTLDGFDGQLIVQDCEIDGLDGPDETCFAVSNALFIRCNIHSSGNDFGKFVNNVTVQDCYFHDPFLNGDDPHFDGLQTLGCNNVEIMGCNFDMPETGVTSNIILTHGDITQNVYVHDNLFSGGQNSVYAGYEEGTDDPLSANHVVIINNLFRGSISHPSGYSPITSADAPVVLHYGNKWYDGPNAGEFIDAESLDWPDASNTGPIGTLTNDTRTSITISEDNTWIINRNFTAGVTLSVNSGVKGTVIRNNNGIIHGFWAVDDAGVNTYIGYNKFDCSTLPAGGVSVGLACGGGARTVWADACLYEFNEIIGSQDGIKAGQYHIIQHNYIHDLGFVPDDSHNDAIQFQDYKGIQVIHNWLESPDTSCIIMGGGESRPRCEDVLVQGNHFQGGIYCLYGPSGGSVTNPPSLDVRVLDNQWSTAVWPNGGANGSNTAWEAGLDDSNVWNDGNIWADGPNAGQFVAPSG